MTFQELGLQTRKPHQSCPFSVVQRLLTACPRVRPPIAWLGKGLVRLFLVLVAASDQGMKAYSRFRLWRIDAAREKLATNIKQLIDPKLTHAQIREAPAETLMASAETQSAAQRIMNQLAELRARCQRQTNSFITPMGDEMFYRYQQSLIDDATTTVGALLQHSKAHQSPNRIYHYPRV